MKTNKFRILLLLSISFFEGINIYAQTYNDKIFKDDATIKAWATGIELHRGWVNIADTIQKYDGTNRASFGVAENALGKAEGNSGNIVSLGDSGVAILSFDKAIYDGEGGDFAVFENSFSDVFLELAFVEVSSDGNRYVRFPATSLTQTETQLNNTGISNANDLYNLAGKYKQGYGTIFNLRELKDSAGLDINNIRFVKVIDAIGSINPLYASYDSQGNMINDPWPTPFNSSGFDLDAVAVIHERQSHATVIPLSLSYSYTIFPNPFTSYLKIQSPVHCQVAIYDISGNLIYEQLLAESPLLISTDLFPKGLYCVKVIYNSEIQFFTIIKQ